MDKFGKHSINKMFNFPTMLSVQVFFPGEMHLDLFLRLKFTSKFEKPPVFFVPQSLSSDQVYFKEIQASKVFLTKISFVIISHMNYSFLFLFNNRKSVMGNDNFHSGKMGTLEHREMLSQEKF